MRTVLGVRLKPRIEINLELLEGRIDLLAERHAVELVEQGLVESLTDSVRLRCFVLGRV